MRGKTTAERVIERKIESEKKARSKSKGVVNYYINEKHKQKR